MLKKNITTLKLAKKITESILININLKAPELLILINKPLKDAGILILINKPVIEDTALQILVNIPDKLTLKELILFISLNFPVGNITDTVYPPGLHDMKVPLLGNGTMSDILESILREIALIEKRLRATGCKRQRAYFREFLIALCYLLLVFYGIILWHIIDYVIQIYSQLFGYVLTLFNELMSMVVKLVFRTLMLPITLPLRIIFNLFHKLKTLMLKRQAASNLVVKLYYSFIIEVTKGILKFKLWRLKLDLKPDWLLKLTD
jgi:hypothetical protein